MTDYIKREDAIWSVFNATTDKTFEGTRRITDCVTKLKNIPSADVVEVVRCKDCKHRYYDKERNLYYCEMYFGLGIVKNNNYCSYGARA